MAINERLIDTEVAAADGGDGVAEQNLILHLDATDVDSYDGDGSVWYDISEHDVTIPLSDNADELELHLNASDSTSYGGSGTTWTDISGNSRNGTINGSPPYDIDRYGSFDFTQNTGDYVEITTNSALQPASTGTTYEFWITPDTSHDTNTLLYYGTTDGYGFWLWNYYGTPYVTAYNSSSGSVVSFSSGHSISNNTLAHVVFTFSSDVNPVVNIYVDGEFKQTSTGSGTIRKDSAVNIVLGRYHTGNANDFEGKMHAVRIYSKVLSASEIGQNYRHGIDYIYTDLYDSDPSTLELHLDPASYSGSGTTWTADTGNNGTLVGNTSYDEELGDFFDLDGSGDYISLNTSGYLDGDFTVEMWWNFDGISSSSGYKMLWGGSGYGNSSGNGLGHYIYNKTIKTWIEIGNLGDNVATSGNVLTAGKWHHIVLTRSGGTYTQYVDGTQVGTGSDSSDSLASPTTRIGAHSNSSSYNVDGRVGQVRVYNNALSADDVMQNYLFTKNNYPNGLNGTINGNVSWTADYFDFPYADGSHITLPDNSLFLQTISISVWVNPDTLNTGYVNVALLENYQWSGRSDGFIFLFDNSGKLRFDGYNGTRPVRLESANAVISAGSWQHVVVTVSTADGIGKLYVGDTEVSSYTHQTISGAMGYTATQPTTIGGMRHSVTGGDSEAELNGKISKLRVYDKVLTQAEITALNNEGSGN